MSETLCSSWTTWSVYLPTLLFHTHLVSTLKGSRTKNCAQLSLSCVSVRNPAPKVARLLTTHALVRSPTFGRSTTSRFSHLSTGMKMTRTCFGAQKGGFSECIRVLISIDLCFMRCEVSSAFVSKISAFSRHHVRFCLRKCVSNVKPRIVNCFHGFFESHVPST